MAESGILNVDKPLGWTSAKVVQRAKKTAGIAKVGHAGTLDPLATGVLLVCVNQAVRITEYLMEQPKVYVARVVLGVATDTYDAEGDRVWGAGVCDVDEARVRETLRRFIGEIEQTPPVFSAVKVDGQPAYRLARKGQQPELKARPVRIDRLELLAFDPPYLDLEIECGRGTYIRSLADDLGQELECGAHLGGLTRTRIGPFGLESALGMDRLEEILAAGTWPSFILPLDYGLSGLPAATLPAEQERAVRHGRFVATEAVACPSEVGRCRVYGQEGAFLAVLRYDAGLDAWRPEKVFSPL